MKSESLTRRNLMGGMATACSAVGVAGLMASPAWARKQDQSVQKLNRDGKPADGTQMITPLITHNGLIYIAGQGANSNGPVGKDDIDSHVTKVLDNVKELVVNGGGSMDSVLQLTVYLTDIANFEAMNKIFK